MRTNNTKVGTFRNGNEYRQKLKSLGYKDLGWVNGWGLKQEEDWAEIKRLAPVEEDMQWNDSGSDVTQVIHSQKIFCSIDMGD